MTIVLSITCWMLSTLPEVRRVPDEGRCRDTQATGLQIGDCEPIPVFFFEFMEHTCVYLFTLEFLIKLSVVWAVRFELNQLKFLEGALRGKTKRDGNLVELKPKWKTMLKWFLSPSTMIDFLAICPYWVEKVTGSSGGSVFVILRILRLTRVFRVFKLGKYNEVFSLFGRVMAQSLPALYLMLFFVGLGLCLFGTLIWFCESGQWFPQGAPELLEIGVTDRGAYLRNVAFLDGVETLDESPFPSIIHTFWFVIVTVTTVGYGDAFPTTRSGKFMGALTMLCGVVVLAMPVGVIGANFSNEYDRVQAETRRKKKLAEQRMQKELQAAEAKAAEAKSEAKTPSQDDSVLEQKMPAAKSGEEETSLVQEDEEILADLKSIEAIMDRAIGLDAELVSLLDLQAAQRPRKDLREFLQELIRRLDKAGTTEQTNTLDQLTYRTFAQFRAYVDFDPNSSGKPTLADIRAFRQRWFAFMDQ